MVPSDVLLSLEECAAAMDIDVGHMDYERLAQSVPPSYGRLVFAQMCMAKPHNEQSGGVFSRSKQGVLDDNLA